VCCLAAALSALSAAAVSAPAAAAPPSEARPPAIATLVLLPTAIGDAGGARPVRADDTDLGRLAQGLDALLADTAQDLGVSVVPPTPGPLRLADADLLDRARQAHTAVVLASVRATSTGDVELRLALARPSGTVVEVRCDRVTRDDLSVRAVVLLRDLVSSPVPAPAPRPAAPAPAEKLAGRITLMVNSAALGGLAGFSVERASGSDDPRLLYPLMIAGAGIGLGAAYLASGEWEVGSGDAWFFAGGAWWWTAAGHLVFQGRFAATRAESNRWAFGLVGSGLGATLATLGLALHPMSDAGAIVANAGGAVGLGLGALVEVGVRRGAQQVPFSGMGYGAGLGWLAAAAVAVQLRPGRLIKRSGQVGTPLLGVIGESRAGPWRAPIVGAGYAGSL
jgi:hypothetical protein